MVDITHKNNTLRIALARAVVKVGSQDTIDAIRNGEVPKGDVFSMSKAAGLLGVKKTPELLPDCHPMPIESTKIDYDIDGLEIMIKVEVKTIYKTGVEVEAMHGASIVALNIYDMLKPIDKNVSIGEIKLISKKGGKSSYPAKDTDVLTQVIVCSDTISKGIKEDRAGKAIMEKLKAVGVNDILYKVIPDESDSIKEVVAEAKQNSVKLLIFTGGTGLSTRDVTPETLIPLLDRRIPGMEEQIRRYGQERMPFAFMSRSVAGTIGGMLVLAVPGSTNGAKESMDALLPHIFHAYKVLRDERHD